MNLIEEKEKEGSSDALRAKDKEIMAATENIYEEVLAHAEIAIRLEESGVLLTRAMKKLIEKQRLIQDQAQLIKKSKVKQGNFGGCIKSERETVGSCRDCKKGGGR